MKKSTQILSQSNGRGVQALGFMAGLILLAASSLVNAAVLTLSPSSTSVGLGDTVSVDLSISGIAPPGLAYIHTDLFWDSSVLSLDSATAGSFFGDNIAAFGSEWNDGLNPFTPILPGVPVDTSIVDPSTGPDSIGLDFLETTTFLPPGPTLDGVLVTLDFTAIGVGPALLSMNDITLFDIASLPVTGIPVVSSDITVTSVPEPSTLLLLGLGLGAAGWMRRLRKV